MISVSFISILKSRPFNKDTSQQTSLHTRKCVSTELVSTHALAIDLSLQ